VIAGATGPTLTLGNVQPSMAGNYSATVTNTTGTATSNVASVSVVTTVAPALSQVPSSLVIATGRSAVFTVVATGSPAPLFQWLLNGTAIPGATDPILLVSGAMAAQAGAYTCVISNSAGTITSPAATLGIVSTAAPGRLVNLSARALAGAGSNLLIGGFGAAGSGTPGLLMRGVGPGIFNTFALGGVLQDPQLGLFDSTGLLVCTNAGWGNPPLSGASPVQVGAQAASAAMMAQVGAFILVPGSTDSAFAISPPIGNYTAQVGSVAGSSGVALVEIYDTGAGGASSRLVNLSARASVSPGTGVLIGGFGISGNTAETVLIRAVGPGLADTFNLAGTLAQPALNLFSGNTPIYSNFGWGADATISDTFGITGAFTLDPAHRDAVLLLSLPPGSYTAVVSGADGGSGIALVEVYEVY